MATLAPASTKLLTNGCSPFRSISRTFASLVIATPDLNGDGRADNVYLFASLSDRTAEGTGIYFGKDPNVLFVNIQHSISGNDKTMVIHPAGTGSVLPLQD